jgi:hypothetical protein
LRRWKPLEYDLENIFPIIHACARLHNFAIRNGIQIIPSINSLPGVPSINDEGILVIEDWRINEREILSGYKVGNSLKNSLLMEIYLNQYHRPLR